jgi:hypothetical protein
MNMTGVAVFPATGYVKHTDGSYWTCVVKNTASAKTNFAFCTNISTGNNFKATPVNYEVMVPTVFGSGTETYYFYAQLN